MGNLSEGSQALQPTPQPSSGLQWHTVSLESGRELRVALTPNKAMVVLSEWGRSPASSDAADLHPLGRGCVLPSGDLQHLIRVLELLTRELP